MVTEVFSGMNIFAFFLSMWSIAGNNELFPCAIAYSELTIGFIPSPNYGKIKKRAPDIYGKWVSVQGCCGPLPVFGQVF